MDHHIYKRGDTRDDLKPAKEFGPTLLRKGNGVIMHEMGSMGPNEWMGK
jgi:hypothetical protein